MGDPRKDGGFSVRLLGYDIAGQGLGHGIVVPLRILPEVTRKASVGHEHWMDQMNIRAVWLMLGTTLGFLLMAFGMKVSPGAVAPLKDVVDFLVDLSCERFRPPDDGEWKK